MANGYTNDIYEGKTVSLEEYLLTCARAFGATIMLRDEPLSGEIPEFQPSDYHLKQSKKMLKVLEEYKKITLEEAEKIVEEEYQKELKNYEYTLYHKELHKKRYQKVLEQVKNWTPPTDDHVDLKEFAVKQLEDSIDWDCKTSHIIKPVKENPHQWIDSRITQCKSSIAYHQKKYQEEVNHTNERNLWVKELKESFNK